MAMLIVDYDAEAWLESAAMSAYYRLMSVRKDAVKRGVKSPDKAAEVRVCRKEYQVLITALRCVRWERACQKAGPGVAILPPQWENGIKAELEAKWSGKKAEDIRG